MRHKQQARTSPPELAFSSANPNQVPQLDAVIIRNLTYEVGRGRQRKTILNKINLTVPEGSIYGLLGPSGCGKTTMLRCMVGRIWPKSGHVMVFGLRPGEGQGEVPGRHVGYMPQEISIYEDFTIEETLSYFGLINRMSRADIKRRVDFLLQFLDLPTKRRTVANLSGGQKRRVSLAAALVHSPPLLILDEPTVGVDPLLRHSIWQHLVAMTKTERISVIITTHYIEEARLANVVGLMRNGRILAEDSPNELMHANGLTNLEDVFLKLCMSDSSRRAAQLATSGTASQLREAAQELAQVDEVAAEFRQQHSHRRRRPRPGRDESAGAHAQKITSSIEIGSSTADNPQNRKSRPGPHTVRINTGTNEIEVLGGGSAKMPLGYVNEAAAVEDFSSEDEDDEGAQTQRRRGLTHLRTSSGGVPYHVGTLGGPLPLPPPRLPVVVGVSPHSQDLESSLESTPSGYSSELEATERYLAAQQMHWATRRAHAHSLMRLNGHSYGTTTTMKSSRALKSTNSTSSFNKRLHDQDGSFCQWWKTLMAVTWKNYVRLRRNKPVLVFQFMLPAIQVILFCLCIGGEPFDVPVAIVNDELVPKSSAQFLQGLNKKIIRQVKYDNLTSAIEAVRRGHVWGALHIPAKYSENLHTRLIAGEDVTNETISNGTIHVYPDLTNLHLAMTLEGTFRESFIAFARNSLEEIGYDKNLAEMPIKVGRPVYGSANKEGYLEFMAPGVVISISYVMATGLTALAFILERRDGLLERSLVSGVQTSQILLAHAINQVFVMSFQIMLVLGCTFFIFEIPSRGPFVWVVLLILLQGCTGMGFGLLVSAICAEENTAVMMVVGTFYTNLILAGIIWPIEAMPHWLRPLSYAQPQTLPTDSLRHILSRGWGITEPGVLLGFGVTIGWLAVFLLAAGIIFKYSR